MTISNIIPTIDFCKANLKPGSEEWESTKDKVIKAFEEYGCFEAIYDKVSNEIREDMFATLKEIFPIESKVKEYLDIPFPMYNEQLPHTPYNEFRCTIDLILPQSIETFANTFWPHHGNPHYCNVVKSYSKSLMELDEMLKVMIFESLGIKDYIDEFLKQNTYSLRFIKYKKDFEGEDMNKPRLIGHTDTGFLSIIKQDQVGLQLLLNNGDWIELNVSPNSFVVLAADSLMAWTNGRIKSAFHKVSMEGDSDRLSIMLFSSPKPGYILEAPKELVDEEHPILFKPFDITEYYKYKIKELPPKLEILSKAYCGV